MRLNGGVELKGVTILPDFANGILKIEYSSAIGKLPAGSSSFSLTQGCRKSYNIASFRLSDFNSGSQVAILEKVGMTREAYAQLEQTSTDRARAEERERAKGDAQAQQLTAQAQKNAGPRWYDQNGTPVSPEESQKHEQAWQTWWDKGKQPDRSTPEHERRVVVYQKMKEFRDKAAAQSEEYNAAIRTQSTNPSAAKEAFAALLATVNEWAAFNKANGKDISPDEDWVLQQLIASCEKTRRDNRQYDQAQMQAQQQVFQVPTVNAYNQEVAAIELQKQMLDNLDVQHKRAYEELSQRSRQRLAQVSQNSKLSLFPQSNVNAGSIISSKTETTATGDTSHNCLSCGSSIYFTGVTKTEWGKILYMYKCPAGHAWWIPALSSTGASSANDSSTASTCPICGSSVFFTGETYTEWGKLFRVYKCPSGHRSVGR
ncbi:MAG: hypothetical protein WCL44_02500 [bacterium]